MVLATLPQSTSSVQQIADRQTALETQLVQTSSVSRALSQPLSSQVPKASASVPAVAKMMRSPVGGCAGSVAREVRSGEGDVGAVIAVLTTLKPSWRVQLRSRFRTCKLQAVQGPEAQQAELSSQSLAQQGGLSFDAVLKSMSRRMSPTSSAEKPAAELLSKRICGIYLERFGGYGQRDLGVIRYQVMTALDFLMAEKVGAAKDTVALLAVMLEQACLDSGRFEVAQILTLQEDIPALVFTNRQLASTSRARAFAPLSDQYWVTAAIAFLMELDAISTKCTELLGSHRDAAAGSPPAQPSPKSPSKKRSGKSTSRGGGGAVDHDGDCFAERFLRETTDFKTWAICLARWVLQTRPDFEANFFCRMARPAGFCRCVSTSSSISWDFLLEVALGLVSGGLSSSQRCVWFMFW